MSSDLYGKEAHCVIEYNFVLFSVCETGGSGFAARPLGFARSAGEWSVGGFGAATAPAGQGSLQAVKQVDAGFKKRCFF
jgi:hypothetical protein